MLMKKLTGSEDYVRALRFRRRLVFAMLCVGLVGFACYFLLVRGSELADYARGFYLGGASGLTLAALGMLARLQYLLTHPDARKKARIVEQDERQTMITSKAAVFAGLLTFFATAGALFVVLPFSFQAYLALMGVLVVFTLAFAAAHLWLSRHV